MLRTLLLILLLGRLLISEEIIVIGDKNFPKETLTIQEIRAVFLDKKRFFIGEKKVLVMNYKFHHPLRNCFEKNILKKSQRSLERYWAKAYYQGKQPPKIIKSIPMLLGYIENVHPSIGYSDVNATFGKEIKILYKGECL
ncbi:MAG TPA: hypothetical protein EYG67_00840 [Campylobacterales bacterium]|nr:hypothetical protein [Campylobacterales bacterium]HIP42273.1 hypothetical protein [Campylobacterales bacterium]